MMNPEDQKLYDRIMDKLSQVAQNDPVLSKLQNSDSYRYQDALKYSTRIGQDLSSVLQSFADDLIGLEDGYDAIMEALRNGSYLPISDFTSSIQSNVNKRNGIGLKVQNAPFNADRASGIAHNASNAETAEEARIALGRPVENFSDAVVDDNIYANAQFQHDAGIDVTITRIRVGSKECEFCDRLAGSYGFRSARAFESFDNARHEDCKCIVTMNYNSGFKQYTVKR